MDPKAIVNDHYTVELWNHSSTGLVFATREEAEKAHLAVDFNADEKHVVATAQPISAKIIFDGDNHLLELLPPDWKDGLLQRSSRIRRAAQNMTIVVTRRTNDFHAALKGTPGIWGCGSTPNAAIGDLISAHVTTFGIQIEWPKV